MKFARPNNNQSITHYLPVCYFLRIQQYPVNTTYNINKYYFEILLKSKNDTKIYIVVVEVLSS